MQSSTKAESQSQAVTRDITAPSAPCPRVAGTKTGPQQFGVDMRTNLRGEGRDSYNLGGRSTYMRVAAMGSVINSCHHPPAALSLSGLQRFRQTWLMSLINVSG